ncbi:hypothetical protein IAD21_05511 [Abditibacteriota bacterium]|nr:hypothetical protein IAD21_05511 [Abditibacteriota bacterium]
MPGTLQSFLADAAHKAAIDLETALMRLPEDKRSWSAGGDARSAIDMVAECAILGGSTAQTIEDHAFPSDFDFARYAGEKDELSQNVEATLALLHENAARVADAIRAVPDENLEVKVQMPWGPMTLTQLMSYPQWNMAYHEGQINFIASILGCLK